MADNKDVFSETSNQRHAAQRKVISNMYAMSALVAYEPFVDKVNSELVAALVTHAAQQQEFDLFTWLQFYAFDVIGEITIGRSFGLIEAGYDKDGLLRAIHEGNIVYGSNMGLVPELHPWYKWVVETFNIKNHWKTLQFVIQREIKARMQGKTQPDRQDFLAKCVELSETGKIDQYTINNVVGSNIGAGSDTTGISLSATVYYLMKYPECLRKLRAELDTARVRGEVSEPITFQEAQQVPYLQAVIKEALRLHPAVGQILSRVVPEGGAELAGRFFPEGVSVTCSVTTFHSSRTED